MFSFGAAPSAEASQIAEATRKAIKGVSASDEFGIVAPTFTFGQAAAPTAGQTAVTPDLAAVKKKDVGADKPGGLLGGGGAAAAGGFGAQSPQVRFCTRTHTHTQPMTASMLTLGSLICCNGACIFRNLRPCVWI